MGRYCARRLLETIPLMLIISIFVFMFIHLLPGDPAKQLAGKEATYEEVEAIRKEFGLDQPLLVQYFNYMNDLFHGDMGRSLKSKIPVRADLVPVPVHYPAGVRRTDLGPLCGNFHRRHLRHQTRHFH